MRMPRLLPLLLALSSLVFTLPAGSQEPTQPETPLPPPIVAPTSPTPTPIINRALEKAGPQVYIERPWLNDLYSWNETFDLDHQQVKPRETGAYCVGNGRAFALIGLSSPLWNWSNLYGASYQEPDLGAMRMEVTRAGNSIWMPKQQIGWVKRSGLVKVRAEGNGLTVESYDFAPVTATDENAWNNPPILVRLVRVQNNGNQAETDIDIALKNQSAWNVKLTKKVEGRDLIIDQKAARAKKRTVWRLGAFNPRSVRIWDDNIHYSVPTLQPGAETWIAFFLLSSDSSRESSATIAELRKTGPLQLLDQTRDYYTKWFEKGTEFSGDAKVADLFEIESIIFKCQHAHSGGFSPLIGYSYTWIRDNNGPIRWFLKTGHPQEAKRAMDFFYGVGSTMGTLPNSIRVDYPLDYKLKDYSNMHVEHAETPNWIVLQHWWYYLATGDLELVRARWNYLKRCVTGQVSQDDKYFFHRDETYLWCIESRTFDYCPFPNYDLSTYAFATDSSFDLASAADHLAHLGKYLEMDRDVSRLKKLADRVRGKAEETYWNEKLGYWVPAQSLLGPLYNAPHANILFNPFWCGYARNDLDPVGETPFHSKRAVEAIRNAYPWLGREDGFWKTTPTVDFFVGMNPGQLLYSLCKARLPWAEKAYRAVFRTATPSGEFAEMYDGEYKPWNPPSWGVGTSGRVRPWEGGLNTESILEYLTGFAPDAGNNRVVFSPHLPEDIKEFTAKRLMVGNAILTLSMKRTGPREWMVGLHLEKPQPIQVIVDFWAGHREFGKIEVDGTVDWEKNVVESNGRQARCRFNLIAEKDINFTVMESSVLSNSDLNPPKPQVFQPEPYTVPNADLLLVTSPSGVFQKHKNTAPVNFLKVGGSELNLLRKTTSSISFLDLDLPVSPEDIAKGLLDEKGNAKAKLAVFGRGAFSSGKHHFKPSVYWSNPKFGQAAKKFMEQGGCLFLGPSYPNRETLPLWLLTLTDGGWEEGIIADKAVATNSSKIGSNQKMLDELDVANSGSEAAHGVTIEGEAFEDDQNLPDGPNEKKMIQDNGRGFNAYYQFAFKSEPGFKHRLWMRVNTGHNIEGMALMVQQGEKWVQLGVRTQNVGSTRHFEALYFDVPEKWITSEQTLFRLVSKSGTDVNAYHLWLYKLESAKNQSLNELLGLAPNQLVGEVHHGLIPKGNQWKVPFVLSQHTEQGAVIIQKIGKGFLVRSELNLEDSTGFLKVFLNPQLLQQLNEAWPGS